MRITGKVNIKIKSVFCGICVQTQCIVFLFLLFTGCHHNHEGTIQSENYPSIYPDYINVTIPFNVAPLNFKMKDKCQRIEVSIKGKNDIIKLHSTYKISIPRHRWKKLLEAQKNDSVVVNITALI